MNIGEALRRWAERWVADKRPCAPGYDWREDVMADSAVTDCLYDMAEEALEEAGGDPSL